MPGPVSVPPSNLEPTTSFVNSTTSSTELLAQNLNRRGAVIVNTDANTLYILYGMGAAATAGNWTYKVESGETWEMSWIIYTGVIEGAWAADGSGYAEITEFA